MEIIKFSALWCPSCLIMNSRLQKIKERYNLNILEYDYDTNLQEVNKYNIGDILPVLIFMQNGHEVKRIVGEISEKKLIEVIEGVNYEKN